MNYSIPKIDYDGARHEYLEYLKKNPGVTSVIEFGEIKAPGLSDIDWLVILDEEKIINANHLLPDQSFSTNFKEAFQHRPIFFQKKLLGHLHEFILPTSFKIQFGKTVDLLNDGSINSSLRNLTVGFDFFKRQKHWLRKPIFKQLPFKKKVALFVSISNHYHNPLFCELDQIPSYYDAINKLRNNYRHDAEFSISMDEIRQQSIKIILSVESLIHEQISLHFGHKATPQKKYYTDIFWSEELAFSDRRDILVKTLLLFPLHYKAVINSESKSAQYFAWKYHLIEKTVQYFLSIGLKNGLVADLGFNNWFPDSLRQKLYKLKSKYFYVK